MSKKSSPSAHSRWAEFRFGVIGGLFARPPKRGQLDQELRALAEQTWLHPTTGKPVQFHVSTIARWYYKARRHPNDRTACLRPRVRRDRGHHRPNFSEPLWGTLDELCAEHPSWTVQLLYDNLRAIRETTPELGDMPSYATVRRHLEALGWIRRPRRRDDHRPEARAARDLRTQRESRGWEMTHVHALWHLDFKDGPLPVLTRTGHWKHPQLFGALDNRSRCGCHLQWYLGETAEQLAHGLGQAMQKRGKPQSIMMDGGAAMKAAETRQGLLDLGIQFVEIPAYTPEHNAIIESFWKQISFRLLPMFERVPNLTLAHLNEGTQAWLEHEYNCTVHSTTGQTPIERLLAGPSVVRDAPRTDELRSAFRLKETRTQRKSDGTITVQGVRFEVPNCYRHLRQLVVRYARWDLSTVDLWDDRLGIVLATLFPANREANSTGRRRPLTPVTTSPSPTPSRTGIAPLLQRYVEQQRETGLPPAYLPKDDVEESEEQ